MVQCSGVGGCGKIYSHKFGGPLHYKDDTVKGSSMFGPPPESKVRTYMSPCPECGKMNVVARQNLDDPTTSTVWNIGGTMKAGSRYKRPWSKYGKVNDNEDEGALKF